MKSLTILFVAVAPVLAAQSAPQTSPPASVVSGVHELWQLSSEYVLRAAQQMPESSYTFKPTPDVRSFGQLIGHVANGQQLFCGLALGQQPVEATVNTKATLVAALEGSNALCAKAYAMSDPESFQPLNDVATKAWVAGGLGSPKTRLFALMMNAWHDNEHYGNIVTYMRLKGMVPPSSQPKK